MDNNLEIIKKIEEVFPKRSMKVNQLIHERPIIVAVLVILITLLIIIDIIFDVSPELITDYKISQNPIKVNGNIRGGCKVSTFLTTCSVEISYKNHDIERTFSFIDFHKGKYEMSIIASADNPSLVTIDLAIDKLMNRFLLSIGIILIPVLIILYSIRTIPANLRIKKIINQINGQKLKPVIVPAHIRSGALSHLRYDHNFFVVVYKIKDSQGKMVKHVTKFNLYSEGGPIIISQGENGEVNVLGIISETNTTPILLDKQFTRCDFTEQEIQELTICLFLQARKIG